MQNPAPSLAETITHPLLWIGATAVLIVIVAQSVIYLKAARRAAVSVGMPAADVKTAFRAGGIAAIGPSIAVCLVALALLALFGTPSTITRIGLVGSAGYETLAANLALGVMGSSLGSDDVTGSMIITMLLALAICGSGWMIVTLIFTPIAKRSLGAGSSTKAAVKRSSRWALVPAGALVGAFFTMGLKEVAASTNGAIVFFTSVACMALLTFLAKKLRRPTLLEFALGASMIVAIAVGYALS